jgi:hypothetical protein
MVCQRYGWTYDQAIEQFERHPKLLGELLILLRAEGDRERKQSNKHSYQSERDERRKRLGVI